MIDSGHQQVSIRLSSEQRAQLPDLPLVRKALQSPDSPAQNPQAPINATRNILRQGFKLQATPASEDENTRHGMGKAYFVVGSRNSHGHGLRQWSTGRRATSASDMQPNTRVNSIEHGEQENRENLIFGVILW